MARTTLAQHSRYSMDDRALAISILQRAREILAARLAERIIEAGEEIIEDALGNSYSSEIESIHEQIALRLTHVNAMLSSLPPTAAGGPPGARPAGGSKPIAGEAIPVGELPAPLDDTRHNGETAPSGAPQATTQGEAVSFQRFVEQVMAGDIDAAGATIAALLDVQSDRGRRCAAKFAEQLATQPDFLAKAMQLRGELQSGAVNGALMLLWECFGLQGMEAIGAMQTIRARLSGASSQEPTMNDEADA